MLRFLHIALLSLACSWSFGQNTQLGQLITTCINHDEVAQHLPLDPPIVVLDNGTVPKDVTIQYRNQEILLLELEDIYRRALKEHIRFSQVVFHGKNAFVLLHLPQKRLKISVNLSFANSNWKVNSTTTSPF